MYGIIFSAGVQVRQNYYSLSGEISQYLLLYSSLFPTFEYYVSVPKYSLVLYFSLFLINSILQECFCWDGVCSHPYFPFARLLGPLARSLLCHHNYYHEYDEVDGKHNDDVGLKLLI